MLGAGGLVAGGVAIALTPSAAKSAASQTWPAFVLVAGLLLIGAAADADGLFRAAGERLARAASHATTLFFGAAVLIAVVTAVLNLDTTVAFLTPVFVYAARSRDEDEATLVYACILLANAGSLFLPGSNLTNLIVLGGAHLNGASYLGRMWAPAAIALAVTAGVLAISQRRALTTRRSPKGNYSEVRIGVGALGIVGATAAVLLVSNPSVWVAVLGILAVSWQVMRGRDSAPYLLNVLGLPTLLGLFGLAVGLGALGRGWTAPAMLLGHLDAWGTVGLAAVATVVVNNLPAAALLSAHVPRHPFALLIGLNVGPNLAPTGSLAWLLWFKSARTAGAHPSIRSTVKIGAVAAPIAILLATAVLVVQHHG